jgi:hypothetical protein
VAASHRKCSYITSNAYHGWTLTNFPVMTDCALMGWLGSAFDAILWRHVATPGIHDITLPSRLAVSRISQKQPFVSG